MFLYQTVQFKRVRTITSKLLTIAQQQNVELKSTMQFDTGLLDDQVPELVEQFNDMGLKVQIFREFISMPNQGIHVHQDGSEQYPKHLAINWPIENCTGTYMCWWEYRGLPIIESVFYDPIDKNKTPHNFYSQDTATKIGECEIVTPTLVNINQYHSVKNTNAVRRMISFRFEQEPFNLIYDK